MGEESRYRSMDGAALYRMLATGEPVVVLDVRTEREFAGAHIPGSVLIPMQQFVSRWNEVPNAGTPVAVISEYGIRSATACSFLREHGIGPLYNVSGGLVRWPGPVDTGFEKEGAPSRLVAPEAFLVENFHLLPKGLALDLAMGEGRNAIYLAIRDFDVDGVDVDPDAVSRVRVTARRLGAPIRAILGNLEDGTYIIPVETYDVIIAFNYLYRPLLPDIREGVKPGGVVVYQTLTTEQARFGPPQSHDHLLEPGELRDRFAGWEILVYREYVEKAGPGTIPRALAGIVARKRTLE